MSFIKRGEFRLRFEEIYVGQQYEKVFDVSEEQGQVFAEVSHDFNLLHLDEEYAKSTMFKGRIAHGMLVASYISGVLGNDFPGVGTVYLEQNLRFVHPVRYGDHIKVQIKVEEKNDISRKLTLKTICLNQYEKVVIDGEAKVLKRN